MAKSFKRRGINARVEDVYDEEPDVELHLAVSRASTRLSATQQEPSPKRRRVEESEASLQKQPPVAKDAPQPPKQPKPPRKQGASVTMEEFSASLDDLQNAILSTEHDTRLGQECPCGRAAGLYRCTQCSDSDLMCQECIVHAHLRTPYHFVDRWNGQFFERAFLSDLGMVVHLGHFGHRCPNTERTYKGRRMVVMDVHGI
ncbi:hypothetical protein H0H93_009030 [Arthromyces matolae]|nr:hypothetical protein H0H93_009030 [Arthromyces matolae]